MCHNVSQSSKAAVLQWFQKFKEKQSITENPSVSQKLGVKLGVG